MNTLVYTMGDEADDILISFKLSEEDRKKYEVVKEKFTSYFIKRRNVIYERARFNCRRQEEGEAVHAFIMDLHRLAMQLRKRNLKARGIGSVVNIASHLVHAQGVEDHRCTTRVNAQQKTSSVISVGSADISKECAETLLESTPFSRKPSWVR